MKYFYLLLIILSVCLADRSITFETRSARPSSVVLRSNHAIEEENFQNAEDYVTKEDLNTVSTKISEGYIELSKASQSVYEYKSAQRTVALIACLMLFIGGIVGFNHSRSIQKKLNALSKKTGDLTAEAAPHP